PGVSCLGHGNGEVLEAMRAQGERVTFASSVFFATDIAEALADDLIAHAPAGMVRANFGCSGSEQVENAMKLAR
ncbi:MAG TPA: aspartate aminotransferase family protein, partial [Halieaceae bacterium]|nr:aspartate aminotransferase family protein [Halieaceae bacterium]